jgi:glutamine amidotransferase
MKIGLIDYGMGNIQSVINGFEAVKAELKVVCGPDELSDVDAVVLPGVGAFGDGIKNLRARGFDSALREHVLEDGKPLLGICLGLQLLASSSSEHGKHEGLGWIPGEVQRLTNSGDSSIRIPHIGWNDVEVINDQGLYEGMSRAPIFYFVHSYAFRPEDQSVVSGYCCHGDEFAASVEHKNIMATQYHPEKSQKDGLKVLSNWCRIIEKC